MRLNTPLAARLWIHQSMPRNTMMRRSFCRRLMSHASDYPAGCVAFRLSQCENNRVHNHRCRRSPRLTAKSITELVMMMADWLSHTLRMENRYERDATLCCEYLRASRSICFRLRTFLTRCRRNTGCCDWPKPKPLKSACCCGGKHN